jgi:hypothetical protein
MNYVWAAVFTLVVLIVVAGGITAVHRWASAFKTKIALDVIVALVTAVVALASQTFIGVLQVFPSAAARSPAKNAPSTALCPTQYSGALLQLWPKAVKRGSHVTIAGDGFPADDVVEITLYGERPPSNGKLDDIGAVRSDACGKFNYSWDIPDSLATSSYTAIEIVAMEKNPRSGDGEPCCRATATLTINAP